MISPELLRRYPFFAYLKDAQLREVAMIAEEESCEMGATLLKEGEAANTFYFLMEGSVDLYYTVKDEIHSREQKEFPVGEINPGEVFGISSMIEPFIYTSTARTSTACRLIKFEASALHGLCEKDRVFCFHFMSQVAKAAIERLNATRVQLAAAWA